MHKALVFGTKDCRLKSCQGQARHVKFQICSLLYSLSSISTLSTNRCVCSLATRGFEHMQEQRDAKMQRTEIRRAEMRTTEMRRTEMRTTEMRTTEMRRTEMGRTAIRRTEVRRIEMRRNTKMIPNYINKNDQRTYKRYYFQRKHTTLKYMNLDFKS